MISIEFKNQTNLKTCQFTWSETEGDIDITSKDYHKFNNESGYFDLIIKNQIENCWDMSDSINQNLFVR